MSMTCKAFLEPGLDSVWYSIDSFEAIVSPFTKSVWRKEEFKNPWPGGPPSILLHLEGPLEAPDVERFTKYYAPRIRKILFNAYCGMTMMSLETCEALNLATNRQPGSLSPFLQQFSWHNFHEIEEIYGERFMLGIAPYVALFTGETTRSVSYNSWTRLPLEAGSIQSISGNVPRLRKLILQTNDFNLVHGILTSSPWNYLEELVVTSLSKDDIPCVGSLPQLSNLHVIRLADLDAPGYGHRTDGAFSTLRELVVCATELHNITSFLKYVDPRNTIHTLACESWYVSPTSESQDLVDTIHTRFNPLTLTHLQVIDGEWGDEDQEYMMSSDVMVEEKQDMEFVEETDISCLFAFPNLKLLTFSVKGRPRITPQGVTKITETWPHLQSLDLCGTHPYGSSQTPYIDHNHLSKILYGCPLLQHLGMPFDATRISESERLPHGPFPKLLNLRICGSPIRSHSRVTAFIQQNIPELKKLDVQYSWKYMECLNQTRWDAVAKALGMEQSWSR